MAGTNPGGVFVGAPAQSKIGGAIRRAPLGTTVPDTATETLPVDYQSGGYVSNAGVTITPEYSTTGITEWGGAEVRKVLEAFNGTVAFAFIQLGKDEAEMIFGEDSVTETPATSASGTQLKIAIGARLPDPGVWVFNLKDGKRAARVLLPNAQPVNASEITLVANDAIALGTELACYPDEDGNSIYIMTDDGVFSA